MSIDGLSLSKLIAEISHKLVGSRIDKIYQVDRYTLIIWARQPGDDVCLLISANPENPSVYLTPKPPHNPAVPPAFCMLLRKHLQDGRIVQIRQHSLDRVLNIDIDVREERGRITTKTLVVELMGKHSNIILKHNNMIIDAVKRVSAAISRYRQVLPGLAYVYPPDQSRINIMEISPHDFINNVCQQHTGYLSKAIMSTALGLGPISIREILWRAKLPHDAMVEVLEYEDHSVLAEAIGSIVDGFTTGRAVPTVVIDSNHHLKAIAAFQLSHLQDEANSFHHFDTMIEAVEFATSFQSKHGNSEKLSLAKLITGELNRLQRKYDTLQQELETANDADLLRKYADLIMANLHTIIPGAAKTELADIFSTDMEQTLIIELDPSLSPVENSQTYYAKYSKLKRAQSIVQVQIDQCEQEVAYLEGVLLALDQCSSVPEVVEIRQELVESGYIKSTGKRHHNSKLPSSTPVTIITEDGATILVGKNNRQNDAVTFKHAKPYDLWFHSQNIPGSHVILRREDGLLTEKDIAAASQLAAFFSKARNSSKVPIDYTQKRYVKKPSGAKPGFVTYRNQKTLYMTPDEQFIKYLMTRKSEK